MRRTVTLPTLHSDQVKAFRALLPYRFKALRAGRRYGKTDYAKTWAADAVIKGQPVGWFAPDYKISSEAYNELADILQPIKLRSSKTEGVIRTKTGGRIDFWTLDNERAGRSRKYKRVIVDEGAFTDDDTMMDIWDKSIKPTLYDMSGQGLVCSNTNGTDPKNFFWRICNEPKHGFHEYHAPTHNNPLLPERLPGETEAEWLTRRKLALKALKDDNHPLVYQQEYLAEFVDWSGVAFFSADKWFVNGAPIPVPRRVDAVFAILDTATKDGKDHDGQAVTFYGLTNGVPDPLTILDWEILQMEGSLLESWLPTVFQRLEDWAQKLKARFGSQGVHIEDKSSGMVLLQQAARRGWPAHPIDTKLTSVGKDERAISVSGYHHRGMIKITQEAFDKVTTYKGATRNHFLGQVTGFRIGDKDAHKRADDLLDTYTYGISIALGNSEGF